MTPTSPDYVLVGNLILGGLAGGLTIMVPMLVSQNSVPTADVSTATSTLQFFQSVAGLLNIAIMQSYFNQLVTDLTPAPLAESYAALLPLATLVNISSPLELYGAATVGCAQSKLPASSCAALDLAKSHLVSAYSTAVTRTFYISIAGALAGLIASFFIRFVPLSAGNDENNAAAKTPSAVAVPSVSALAAVDVEVK